MRNKLRHNQFKKERQGKWASTRTIRRFRVPCSGEGCQAMVLRDQGECRNCRRARVHAGLKRIRRAERANG